MGLTNSSTGSRINSSTRSCAECDALIALAGNPNVGKSTVFNALTGLRRHTGNWTGKSVDTACGYCESGGKRYAFVDLPGCYSLSAASPEEDTAREYIESGQADCIALVCDASCMSRCLNLVIQTLEITSRVVVCVNLIDEAKKSGIHVDVDELSLALGVEAVATSAINGRGLDKLVLAIERLTSGEFIPSYVPMRDWAKEDIALLSREEYSALVFKRTEQISASCVIRDSTVHGVSRIKLDRFLTGKVSGFFVMAMLLGVVFYITMIGANYPSELLSSGLFWLLDRIKYVLSLISAPSVIISALCDGILNTLFRVVSVMLPPMAIFFPMFALLEDLGYLPRVAFNLDRAFTRCHACGKQSLTMCMGFGCNAAGVIGCRIIESPRERLIAIITNSLVPCNGRFPTLTALISIFFVFGAGAFINGIISAAMLTALIILGVLATLFASWLLSKTLLKGKPSPLILELPPFRKPRIGQIVVRSILDRTLFVLSRAVAVAIPAGLLIWLLAFIKFGDGSLLSLFVDFLDPIGVAIGVDGAILMAFLLGIPANELVLPLLFMIYSGTGVLSDFSSLAELRTLLIQNGWTVTTAICVLLLMLFHSPCSTTLITIKKETGSIKWTVIAFLLPTVFGVVLCALVNLIGLAFGI